MAHDRWFDAARAQLNDALSGGIYWVRVGAAAWDRYRRSEELPVLDEAIAAYRRAIAATPPAHPDLGCRLSRLGFALTKRFNQVGEQRCLDEAVRVHQQAVKATPGGHAHHQQHLSQLVTVLRRQLKVTRDTAILDDIVSAQQQLVDACSDNMDRAHGLYELGGLHWDRFERTGELSSLTAAVETYRRATEPPLHRHDHQGVHLTQRATALATLIERAAEPQLLDEMVRVRRQLVDRTPRTVPEYQPRLADLTAALWIRYRQDPQPGLLEELLAIFKQATAETMDDHLHPGCQLSNVAVMLTDKLGDSADPALLAEIVDLHRQAVKMTPVGHPHRLRLLGLFGTALDRHYRQSGNATILDEVIDVCLQLVDSTSPDNPDRLNYLVNLSRVLLDRYRGTEDDGMLEEIIAVHRDLTAALPKDDPDRPRHLSNLGFVLLNRFRQSQNVALLDPTIDVFRQAVAAMPAVNPQRPKVLFNLGGALVEKAARTDPSEQQERWQEAVAVLRAGADALPTNDPEWPIVRSHLGAILQRRFEQLNELADLQEAVTVFRNAVETTPVESPHWLTCLLKLADATLIRAKQRDSTTELLNEAITTQRRLLDATPINRPERMNQATRLADALQFRYHRFGDLDALDEAISIHRALAAAIPPGHPGRRCALHNLGNALRVRDVAADHPIGVADETLEILREAAGFSSSELEQVLPITIYLSDESAHEQVEIAIEDLLATAGGHIQRQDDPTVGSWFRRVWAQIGGAAHSPWAQEAAIVATHAAESRLVHAQDATVTATLMQNLGPVIAALQPTEEAVIRLGALLLVKIADKPLVVLQLTSAQQLALDHQPQIAKSPHDILSALELQPGGNALETNDTAGVTAPTTRSAVPADLNDPRHHAQHLSDFVEALGIRAMRTQESSLIEEMITALPMLTGGPDDTARHLRNLGSALLTYYSRLGGTERLNKAIETLRQAVAATPAGHADRPSCLALLGEALHRRFQGSDDVGLLDEALEMLREAIEDISADDPQRGDQLSLFGRALQDRYDMCGDRSLLKQAVTAYQQAATLPSIGTLDRCRLLSDLGGVLLRLARHTDKLATFRDAAHAHRQAVEATPVGHPDRARHLCGLGGALMALSERSDNPARLEEAITILHQARAAAPDGHPHQVVCLVNLSSALRASYQRSGVQAHLDEAIQIGERAAELSGEPTIRALACANLSGGLLSKYYDNTDVTALDDAVRYALQALEELPADHVDRGDRLTGLGDKLLASHWRTGKPELLDKAVNYYRQAILVIPADHAHLADVHNNLGLALFWHYDHTGELRDLNESISLLQQAVEATPAQHPRRPEHLTHLGLALENRYRRTGDQSDLNEALERQQEAITAAQHLPQRISYLNNLGNVLMSLFHLTGDSARLDRSIRVYREACAACPAGHPVRPRLHANLSLALRARYRQTGRAAVIDEAVEMQRRAVAGTLTDDSDRPVRLAELSAVLLIRHERLGNDGDLVEAAEVLRQAVAAAPAATPRGQIDVYADWGRLAARTGDWTTALDALATAVQLLPRVVPAGAHRDDQEYQLARFVGIASDAAACALQVGDRWRAVELLEHGRGLLVKRVLARGEELELRERDGKLADQVDRLRAEFARGSDVTVKWEQLMKGIRAMPGFERFLLPPVIDNLRTDRQDGPVVLINVSRFRSDALVLDASDVQVIPLPTLDPDNVRHQVKGFLAAIDCIFDHEQPSTERHRARQDVRGTLCWLWEAVAAPVLDALALPAPADPEALPQLWWSPTGLLSLLPLHAAGHHHDHPHHPNGQPRTVIDRVVSSYTSTVSMLHRARRQQQDPPAGTPPVLMVSMPNAPGAGALRQTWNEAFASAGQPDIRMISGVRATRQRVIEQLPAYPWVHFACHSCTDLTHPSASYLVLHDHVEQPLTVQDISGLRLRRAQLAYLSACDTARTSDDLADEAIHLASSFQTAGYPHVVGTLWPVGDRLATMMAKEFYGALAKQNCIATAVHHATRELRKSYRDRPWWWGAYIHMGS